MPQYNNVPTLLRRGRPLHSKLSEEQGLQDLLEVCERNAYMVSVFGRREKKDIGCGRNHSTVAMKYQKRKDITNKRKEKK